MRPGAGARPAPRPSGVRRGPDRPQRRRPGALGDHVEWENVGAYRRALSAYDVKVGAVPLLSTAIDEPSAYEVVEPGAALNIR